MQDQQKNEEGKTVNKLSKLGLLLQERGLSQADFIRLIEEKTNITYQKGRISRYVNKKNEFYSTETVRVMAKALGVTPNEIID